MSNLAVAQSNFDNISVEYETADIRELRAVREPGKTGNKGVVLTHKGDRFKPTQRFWNSFSSRFGIGDTVFRYFSHEEVFNRIADTTSLSPEVRLTKVNNDVFAMPEMIAMSSPDKPVIEKAPLTEILRANSGANLSYHKGHVTATFTPKSGQDQIIIGRNQDEVFTARYVFEAPIDGYGKPRIFLMVERLVCTNGMVARTAAFRSDVNIGDNPYDTINRALAAYDNEEGYSAISNRLVAAQQSSASVKECMDLRSWLEKAGAGSDMLSSYDSICGDLALSYGLASANAISKKRQAMLPTEVTVYDLFNIASEFSTHHATQASAMSLSGWLGSTLCSEYDLEGQLETQKNEFADFFLR